MANKLKPSVKKWLRALRSGKYKQTTGALRKKNKFCCLGVICDLAVKEGIIKPPIEEKEYYDYGGVTGVLPEEVQKWLGLSDSAGGFYDEDGCGRDLTELNDAKKYSFKKIAKLIESAPQGLFA
jgi:hypothetical protein